MAIKKRPVSPRQKMINLMYVILMAMLALNTPTDEEFGVKGKSVVEKIKKSLADDGKKSDEEKKNIDLVELNVNELDAFVIPEKTTLYAGERFNSHVVMAAIDSTQRPEIYVNGSRLNAENGRYSFVAGGVGEHQFGGLADGSFHFVRVHRLEQIIAGTQMHGLVGVLEQTVGRNKDHLALRALFQHGAGCIQTVHTGHLNVHQDQVCAPQHRRIRCLAAVLGSLDGHFVLKAAGHDVRQRFPFQCFIIRDQQTNHSSNSSSFSTNGRYSTTAVPRPGWDRITKRLFRSSRRRRAATL